MTPCTQGSLKSNYFYHHRLSFHAEQSATQTEGLNSATTFLHQVCSNQASKTQDNRNREGDLCFQNWFHPSPSCMFTYSLTARRVSKWLRLPTVKEKTRNVCLSNPHAFAAQTECRRHQMVFRVFISSQYRQLWFFWSCITLLFLHICTVFSPALLPPALQPAIAPSVITLCAFLLVFSASQIAPHTPFIAMMISKQNHLSLEVIRKHFSVLSQIYMHLTPVWYTVQTAGWFGQPFIPEFSGKEGHSR